VRPSKSIHDVQVKSVKKKWKVPSFAAGASREEMEHTIEALGIERDEHIGNVLAAMQGIAAELGLEGVPAED
jgi:predicted hydrolase (HD superfamily)